MPACRQFGHGRAQSMLFRSQEDLQFSDIWRAGHGFLMVYDVAGASSFRALSRLREQILRVKDADSLPIVIVANKARAPRCPAL